MKEPYLTIPEAGFHFTSNGIKKIEEMKNAKYMGYWSKKTSNGSWSELPVDIFYVENPDTSQGHTHYFGMFVQNEKVYITEGSSAFSETIIGILCDDGEVLVSRYRHDYREKGSAMIDGGRDYTRSSVGSELMKVTVNGPEFVLEKVNDSNA